MSKMAKVMVAAIVAAISFGALAPAASARTTIWTQLDRIEYRANRAVDRLVTRVGENVERETLQLGEDIDRMFNPR